MIRRLVGVGLAVAALGAVGCGEREVPSKELRDALAATEQLPKTFVYREDVEFQAAFPEKENQDAQPEILAQTNEVRGKYEDDFRFSMSVAHDGRRAFDAVIADDALAVKLTDTSVLPGNGLAFRPVFGQQGARGEGPDFEVYEKMLAGEWVLDYAAAPPLALETTKKGGLAIGLNPGLDAAFIFQYFRRSIDEAGGVQKFNPDSPFYNPADDPWASDKEANLDDKGITRFDLIPPDLPRRDDRGTQQAQPTPSMFRKMAFYVRGGRLLKVVEKIDIEGQKRFRRLIDLDEGSDYVRTLFKSVMAGGTREPVREREMSFELFDIGEDVSVEMPPNPFVGRFAGLFGGPGKTPRIDFSGGAVAVGPSTSNPFGGGGSDAGAADTGGGAAAETGG